MCKWQYVEYKTLFGGHCGSLNFFSQLDSHTDSLLFIAKVLTSSLFAALLQIMVPMMFTCWSELVSKWEKLIGSKHSHEINAWPELLQTTADVIARTGFSTNYKEGMRIFRLEREQAQLVLKATQTIHIPGFRCVFFSLFILSVEWYRRRDGLRSKNDSVFGIILTLLA